jgi:hypothetical protein
MNGQGGGGISAFDFTGSVGSAFRIVGYNHRGNISMPDIWIRNNNTTIITKLVNAIGLHPGPEYQAFFDQTFILT